MADLTWWQWSLITWGLVIAVIFAATWWHRRLVLRAAVRCLENDANYRPDLEALKADLAHFAQPKTSVNGATDDGQ